MQRVSIDSALLSQLLTIGQPVELCNESGQVLGKFIPAINMADWEPVGPDITREELDRRLRSNEKRYTTKEVLAHLETR